MSKYQPLAAYLAASVGRTRQLSLAAIESLLGFVLPGAARKYRQWWANDATHVQSHTWLDSGFRVVIVDLIQERVEFQRI
jgi:hypothetical protein